MFRWWKFDQDTVTMMVMMMMMDDDDDDDKSHDDDLISVWSNHLQSHAWCPLRLESPG